jgi:hypothetical protein
LDFTSGLPDDSRDAEERIVSRHLAELLVSDWRRAAMFYARFGVREESFRNGGSTAVSQSNRSR